MPNSTADRTAAPAAQEVQALRALADRYAEVSRHPDQDRRRDDWQRHNSLERIDRVLIYVRAFAWDEMPQSDLACENPVLRGLEKQLRIGIFRSRFEDDFVIEPWLTVPAALELPGEGIWGPPLRWTANRREGGAGVCEPPLKELEDIEKIVPAPHRIDEARTSRRQELAEEVLQDRLPVVVDRSPLYRSPTADISGSIAQLRGLEQIMWDMYDNPEWLHRLLELMRDGILRNHREAEKAGDWRRCSHDNQAVNYARELPDPSPDPAPVPRGQLWCRMAAQELTLVGPEQWEEFMFRYQVPIMSEFGLAAYGCCEEMASRIPALKRVPNVRRIAVTPVSDAPRCAQLIGDTHVASYRPSPADMVSYGWNEDRVRSIVRRDLEAFRANGCHVDVTLKDVETVQGDPDRVVKWVQTVRSVCAEVFGGG
ncbi:MAG: hypothetical protein ACYTGB_14920 [Planctomycetota bacterium]|jgi:hypothetical protein